MHGSTSGDVPAGSGRVGHLVDRHPSVSPERLIAQLRPPPTFADVSFATYRPDPAEPTQAAALAACQDFCRQAVQRRAGRRKLLGKRAVLPGVGIYLDGGFGVGKTHLLASAYYQLPGPGPDGAPDASTPPKAHPKAFATFGELTQLAGVFGFAECIDLLANYTVVCIDEFELDDPGNTTLISRMLSSLVERGVSVAATSNTLPEQLGEGRFAAQDFLREINTLAGIFTTVRIDGPDYRHRGLPPAPQPLSDEEVVARGCGRGDPRRLRCAVCASGDHAPVALFDTDRGCDGGVFDRCAWHRGSARRAEAGGPDRSPV
jgi:cell division protein ZapE